MDLIPPLPIVPSLLVFGTSTSIVLLVLIALMSVHTKNTLKKVEATLMPMAQLHQTELISSVASMVVKYTSIKLLRMAFTLE